MTTPASNELTFRALETAREVLKRHLPQENAQVITEHARRSIPPGPVTRAELTEELLIKISQATAIFLAPQARLAVLGELRKTLGELHS